MGLCGPCASSPFTLSWSAGVQSDHEKQVQRARETKDAAASNRAGQPTSSLAAGDVASLYKKQDLSLKAGETIKYVSSLPCGIIPNVPCWQ